MLEPVGEGSGLIAGVENGKENHLRAWLIKLDVVKEGRGLLFYCHHDTRKGSAMQMYLYCSGVK
jgi:hypothetical protein